ncbi:MAG: HD-GYP domain-containing protein [Gammaproteobacteria bacterium]|nr:HD-GYP domain-containing protein [Gammaproteobacteria bacterium]
MEGNQNDHGLDKLMIAQLEFGMYITKLDRPWLETSFAVQGFYLRDRQTIERLGAECAFVYVDPRRYKSQYAMPKLRVVASNDSPQPARNPLSVTRIRRIAPRAPKVYEDQVETGDELVPARTSIDDAVAILEPIIEKIRTAGRIEIDQIEAAVTPLVASVLRNKDAVAALLRIRSLDNYTYSHCISNAVWAAILGRHLGYTVKQINKLAMGCALLDIGKVCMPQELLIKPGLPTEAEWEVIREHVAAGLAILDSSSITDRDVLTMVAMHHERYDGSGYPNNLEGPSIPAYGQIAGIIDTYDAMITERPYAAALSSYDAVNKLHQCADVLFQSELVEQLTQAIGVFPTGTLVELNTGEVGIVTAQNADRRLRPKITLILNEDKKLRAQPLITDLKAMDTDRDKAPTVWITKELPQGAYGIDGAEYIG